LKITSTGVFPKHSEIHCGEAGLSVRMFTSIAALSPLTLTITGSGSLLQRPMDFFDEVFPQLNVGIKSNHGKLPFQIKGPIIPQTIKIDGSLSSQFLTGLLFAYSASNANDVSIEVTHLKSKPYVDLTLNVLNQFGMKVPENKNYESFYFDANNHSRPIKKHDYTVEGDWSGGAFLLVAGAIAGVIEVKGLDIQSTQADKEIIKVLQQCGCAIKIETDKIYISQNNLVAFNFDATECPDLFPPLVSLASYCNGNSIIKGISRLTHKESNRALTLKEEFEKLGIKIELKNDDMIVYGTSKVIGNTVDSRNDHRIAMALAVAGLKSEGQVQITNAEAINKSYPNFYDHLKLLGAELSSEPV